MYYYYYLVALEINTKSVITVTIILILILGLKKNRECKVLGKYVPTLHIGLHACKSEQHNTSIP